MEYGLNQASAKQQYTGATLGAIAGANIATPKQPTVASALGRIESLNGRLSQVAAQLAAISDAVGGPRPAGVSGTDQTAPLGIVYRLNEGADAAHRQLSDIEELINSIGRALG